MDDEYSTRTILDAAAEHLPRAETYPLQGYEHVAVKIAHPTSHLSYEDLEKFAPSPRGIRQVTTHETPQSFCDYVNDFTTDRTRIFASLEKRLVVARIDFHASHNGEPRPSWCTHIAKYPAAFSEPFDAWASVHGNPMSQGAFAEFLQDRAEDALDPDPADLMEVASKFEAVRNVEFKSAINVSSGERQFRYEEKDSPAGAIACPKVLHLRTPVFYGCEPVEWAARLAYNINSGKLFFTVKIHRFAELLDLEFERLVTSIGADCPGAALHRGVS